VRLHIYAGLAFTLFTSAQIAQAQQFITAINIDYDDSAGAPDVHIDLASSQANTLVSDQYLGANVKALTQLGVNKVYGSTPSNGVELSATSAWLDHFTVAGPAGSTVKMSFSFAVDGLAAFNDASGYNSTHFNFQVFALRGDNWTINGLGTQITSDTWYTPKVAGTDYDELFFQRYVPERNPQPGQTPPPGQTKLPAAIIQLDARNPETGMFNYAATAAQTPGTFGSNVNYDAALDAYISKSVNPMNGMIITTTFYDDRRVMQVGANPPSTLRYDATGPLATQAAQAALTRTNFELNYSLLGMDSFCPMDSLAGEMQCGPGSYDNVVSVEFNVLAGSTFALAGVMVLDELDNGVIDFFNTARLSKIGATVVGDPTAAVTLTSQTLGKTLEIGRDGFSYPSMVTTAVPEPASWAMMIGGFALIGGLMRRRATAITFA